MHYETKRNQIYKQTKPRSLRQTEPNVRKSHAVRRLLSWAPLPKLTAMGRESHTHQPG